MPKFFHADVLDGGLLAIKNGAVKMMLIKNYSMNDSYATVIGNKVAEIAVASTDFTLATSGNNRTLTCAAKAGAVAVAAGGAGDHHVAFTDGAAKVLAVTDETGEATVAVNDTVNFPATTLTKTQPT